ncbi:AfsR/SARP family transcriptional regulator [Fodinicola acaciae]|uniref:AfsR/SARP family transcriptional regulator n=1 Tax=Fodinicola acaciae TaxID=2681555 RepID=UPI0013D6FF7A|nr:BTAD domain-containing putative transcriptional regulator [Fodinicola acaciae]
MEFAVLGAVEARAAGRRIDVGHARQQCVLAALLVDANNAIPPDTLIERAWDVDVRRRAHGTLYSYISRLRRALGDTVIRHTSAGYVFAADPERIDLHRFRQLLRRAHTVDDDDAAIELFDQALGLWRGEAFASLDTGWLQSVRDQLNHERLAAELAYNDLRLQTGQHATMLAELSSKVLSHPLDERLVGQLMLALYRSGRQADALVHYERLRRELAEALGSDPGAPLRQLHHQILTADAALVTPSPRHGAVTVAPPIPRQLPTDVAAFTGRQAEIDALDALLPDFDAGGPILIAALGGMGGVGKTSLAVHWAHRVADRFPDGQLYVNLRGYGPAEPLEPSAVLASFLRALAVPASRIPHDVDARAALLRTTLTGKRVLMVLDNARDSDQVRPLLPGSGPLVLVTSRSQLRGLVARDGARRITLDQLSEADSLALLRKIAPLAAASAGAGELVRLCGYLPLALAITAERATRTPGDDLTDLVAGLRDERRRLDELHNDEDFASDLRVVLSWSYGALDPDAARVFRLLAALPGTDGTAAAVAAMAAKTVPETRKLLDGLVSASQLQERRPGHYEQHDLIRRYAAELPDADRAEARPRIIDWYVRTALNAREHLPGQLRAIPVASGHRIQPLTFTDRASALSWLDAERNNLIATVGYAADAGEHPAAWRLAAVLQCYFNDNRPWHDSALMLRRALESARRSGDPDAEAVVQASLGDAYQNHGAFLESIAATREALEQYRKLGDRAAEAGMLTNLGMTLQDAGHPEEAIDHHRQALEVNAALGRPALDAMILGNLAAAYVAVERYREGIELGRQALEVSRTANRRMTEADILDELGAAHAGLGEYATAADYYQQAIDIYQELKSAIQVNSLIHLGYAQAAAGDAERARSTWQRGLAMTPDPRDLRAVELREALATIS